MKSFFFSRLLREKLLITALLGLAAAVWFSHVSRSGRLFLADWRANTTVLKTQQQWIDNSAQIQVAATKAVDHLDPSRTFNGSRLLGELTSIADQVGVRSNTSGENLSPQTTGQFSVNTVKFSVRNVDLPAILNFHAELEKRAPYIGLEQFSLVANPSNPTLLSATLNVSSVEINR